MSTAVIATGGEGELLWFGGGTVRFKVRSAETGGVFALIEDSVRRGKTTPLHAHPTFEETFYVLHGEMLFHLDGKEVRCGAGSAVVVPRGAAHAFLVTSDTASFLTLFTPGDVAEAFLREGGDPATSAAAAPPALDIPRVIAAGEKTGGMVTLGPPPFAAAMAGHPTSA